MTFWWDVICPTSSLVRCLSILLNLTFLQDREKCWHFFRTVKNVDISTEPCKNGERNLGKNIFCVVLLVSQMGWMEFRDSPLSYTSLWPVVCLIRIESPERKVMWVECAYVIFVRFQTDAILWDNFVFCSVGNLCTLLFCYCSGLVSDRVSSAFNEQSAVFSLWWWRWVLNFDGFFLVCDVYNGFSSHRI